MFRSSFEKERGQDGLRRFAETLKTATAKKFESNVVRIQEGHSRKQQSNGVGADESRFPRPVWPSYDPKFRCGQWHGLPGAKSILFCLVEMSCQALGEIIR